MGSNPASPTMKYKELDALLLTIPKRRDLVLTNYGFISVTEMFDYIRKMGPRSWMLA